MDETIDELICIGTGIINIIKYSITVIHVIRIIGHLINIMDTISILCTGII